MISNGALTKARLTAALKPKLATDAPLVSNANPIYTAFCDAEGFSHETVNAYHSGFKQRLARFHGVATNYFGRRRAFEQRRQIEPETLLNAALGNCQYLTVT